MATGINRVLHCSYVLKLDETCNENRIDVEMGTGTNNFWLPISFLKGRGWSGMMTSSKSCDTIRQAWGNKDSPDSPSTA